jgi:hypothetical protein
METILLALISSVSGKRPPRPYRRARRDDRSPIRDTLDGTAITRAGFERAYGPISQARLAEVIELSWLLKLSQRTKRQVLNTEGPQ